MGSVVPLHAHPARHEADRLASAAPPSAAFRIGALGAQARRLTLLGTDAPLPILLDALARYVETWAPSLLCSILLRDPRRNATPSRAVERLAGLLESKELDNALSNLRAQESPSIAPERAIDLRVPYPWRSY